MNQCMLEKGRFSRHFNGEVGFFFGMLMNNLKMGKILLLEQHEKFQTMRKNGFESIFIERFIF